MKRRLFLLSGSASAVATALTACGGGGGGADAAPASPWTTRPPAPPSARPAPETPATATAANPTPVASTPSDHGRADAAQARPGRAAAGPSCPTTPAASAGGLPAKILGCYFTAWDTAYRITDVPTDFNVIYLFHCKPNGTPVNGSHNNVGNGSFMFEFFNEVTAAQVQTCRARGQKVILTVGGAGAGYAWDNRTKSTNFVASFKTIVDRLGGVDGIDFNNYEGSIVTASNLQAVSAEMVWIAQQLRAAYGANFAITSPASPNETTQQQMMVALKNAGMLTYAAPQYYDWSGFNAVGYIKNATDTWSRLLGENMVAVGFSANYANGPSLSDCTREWAAIKAAHPNIRGMFCWSAQTNLNGGNSWGRTMKAALLA